MTYTLSHLLRDDRVVINIEGDTWRVWYPLDNKIDIEEVNIVLDYFDIEFKEQIIENFHVSSDSNLIQEDFVEPILPMTLED